MKASRSESTDRAHAAVRTAVLEVGSTGRCALGKIRAVTCDVHPRPQHVSPWRTSRRSSRRTPLQLHQSQYGNDRAGRVCEHCQPIAVRRAVRPCRLRPCASSEIDVRIENEHQDSFSRLKELPVDVQLRRIERRCPSAVSHGKQSLRRYCGLDCRNDAARSLSMRNEQHRRAVLPRFSDMKTGPSDFAAILFALPDVLVQIAACRRDNGHERPE